MSSPPVKTPGGWLIVGVIAAVLLAAATPSLISLSNALLPLGIAVGVVVVVLRLVFFHTRRW